MGNLPVLIHLVNSLELSFIGLQEVMLRSTNLVSKFTTFFPTYRWMTKLPDRVYNTEDMINLKSLSYHGVALGICEKYWESVKEVTVRHNNIIAVTVDMGGRTYLVANLYLPTRGHDDEFEAALFALQEVMMKVGRDVSYIMMGDLNVEKGSSPRRRAAWAAFVEEYHLVDHVKSHITHRHHVWGTENELDRFVTREANVEDVQSMDLDINYSDHFPVVAEVLVEKDETREDPKGAKVETKVNIMMLEENIEEFKDRTNDLAADFEQFTGLDRDVFNAALSMGIFETAVHCTGQKLHQSQQPRKQEKVKIDRSFYNDLRRRKAEWKRAGSQKKSAQYKRYVAAKQRLQREVEMRGKEQEAELNLKIMRAAKTRSPNLFALLRDMKQETPRSSQIPSRIEGYGESFDHDIIEAFAYLYSVQTMLDEQPRYDEEAFYMARKRAEIRRLMQWSEAEFQRLTMTRADFDKIINKLKRGKAQDCYGFCNDLLKMLGDDMLTLIFEFCRDCLEEDDVGGLLRNFGKGVVIMKKPGKPPTLIGTWRKIVSNDVINVVIQMHIQADIERRISEVQTRWQLGFTRGIPVTNAVVLRMEVANLARHMKRPCFMIVLDLKSCFPSISREQLLEQAADVLTPAQWSILDQIYTDTWGEIRMQAQRSKPFYANRGTIEGGILSPVLLKLFLSSLLTVLGDAGFDAGLDFEKLRVGPGQVAIADDLYGWVWTEDDVHTFLKICEWWTNLCRSEFSATKSNIVIVGAEEGVDYGPFEMYGQKLDIVPVSEHLGVPVTEGPPAEQVLQAREGKVRRGLYGSISYWNPKGLLTIAVKLELWKDTFRPMFLYSLETVDFSAAQTVRIELFQIKVLRSILQTSTRAKMSLMRLLTGLPTLMHLIWTRRLGVLNAILEGETIALDYCAFMVHCNIKNSWTVRTVEKLHTKLKDTPVDVWEFMCRPKQSFKTDLKILMEAEETVKLQRSAEISMVHAVPPSPFKNPLPLIMSDFGDYHQRLVRSYVAVYTGDFYRNFNKPCYLCGRELDSTRHMLSRRCVLWEKPEVQSAYADIKLCLQQYFPGHAILSEVTSEDLRVRWLLNPNCPYLGASAISAEDLQMTSLDTTVKKFHHSLIKQRYAELERLGFTVRRRF